MQCGESHLYLRIRHPPSILNNASGVGKEAVFLPLFCKGLRLGNVIPEWKRLSQLPFELALLCLSRNILSVNR